MTTPTQFKELIASELSRIEQIVFDTRIQPRTLSWYTYSNTPRQAILLARQRSRSLSLFAPFLRLIALF